MSEDPCILARINDGRTVRTHACDCGSCGNEWFVPGYSDEWMPSFCPYCGIKFTRLGDGGEPMRRADHKPTPGPATRAVMEAVAKHLRWELDTDFDGVGLLANLGAEVENEAFLAEMGES